MIGNNEYDLNHRDFQRAGKYNPEADATLLVKFYMRPRLDQAASKKEGRPIYKEVEHIDIRVPGNRNAGAARPATPADKERFAEHYRRFKDRVSQDDTSGTLLSEWAPISRSQAEELAFFHVKTVEQLANMSDTQVSKFMGMMGLKERAKEWLDKINEDKKYNEVAEEAKAANKKNSELEHELNELKQQLADLQKNVQTKPKKSRKKKAPEEAQTG